MNLRKKILGVNSGGDDGGSFCFTSLLSVDEVSWGCWVGLLFTLGFGWMHGWIG